MQKHRRRIGDVRNAITPRGSSTKAVLPENEKPAARYRRSSTKVVPAENENPEPAARDGRSRTKVVLAERKSSRPPETAVPACYQRMKNQPAAGDGRSSSEAAPSENENLATTGEGKSSWPAEMAVPVLKLYTATERTPTGRRRRPFQY